jgi:signal transduction histidine kinase
VVYFLGLLAAALGVASFLVYQWGKHSLEAKRQATEELLNAQCQMREDAEKLHLDEALRKQAETLARLVEFQATRIRYRGELAVAGLVTSYLSPEGGPLAPYSWGIQVLAPPPPAGSAPHRSSFLAWEQIGRVVGDLRRKNPPHIQLDTDELLQAVGGELAEYLQIDSTWGSSYRSDSLEDRSLPFDPTIFDGKPVAELADDIVLAPDIPVRRVILKAPAGRASPFGWRGRGPRPGWAGPPSPPASASRDGGGRRTRSIFVQCASERRKLDETLQQYRAERDGKLAALQEETTSSLKSLRNRLLVISTVTFAAAALGCFGLVWLGLAPLRRLSDAVGRISPKDFRLPLDARQLPAELKPIVQRLADTLVMLQRAFAREKQATADISHELRTPLAALLTTTEIALRKPRSAEQYQELLQDCRHSAQQMNQAVERLLTLARLDAGVDTVRPQAVDVAALAEQCVSVVRPLAEARGLRLAVHNKCAPTDRRPDDRRDAGPTAEAGKYGSQLTTDPDKLREVLTNLLHNAIQYNRPEGAIDLTVARENGHLHVEVRDTGIGIAPEARERIFERFYRADPSRGEDGLHTGLGLAIVKEYLNLLGGTIDVDSAPGEGSTFRLRLPVQPARPDEG